MASPINNHIHTGQTGERMAQLYLQEQGYTILEKNYRYKRAEIDIIARKDALLVFVEVKTRASDTFGFPEAAVNSRKEKLVVDAAEEFILANGWEQEIRFDIISVTLTTPPAILHFEDAFH
ncbi:YraN family protein [Pontibacter sp. KCTC 32443]|uniref:YraN family protein n=1 Tax=Pontibacter TaxID=323449 RepID=UPI00164E3E94|nr:MULTISPECIES: YraN family protein [Pontibacter]MBC5775801.1 YraN family protein [Pontibacter sp. KCTC 32443]